MTRTIDALEAENARLQSELARHQNYLRREAVAKTSTDADPLRCVECGGYREVHTQGEQSYCDEVRALRTALARAEADGRRLYGALKTIADADFRGHRNVESAMAFAALREIDAARSATPARGGTE